MKITEIDYKTLKSLIESSNSIAEVIRKLGYSLCKTSYKVIYKRCNELGISYSHIVGGLSNRKGKPATTRMTDDEYIKKYLIQNSKYPPCKKRLIQLGILEQKCYGKRCSLTTTWLNEVLILQLDHINGIHTDNTPCNLRFLCPNCHSQTKTFSGRNNKRINNKCVECNKNISKVSIRCVSCNILATHKCRKFEITPEDLTARMKAYSMTEIGRQFGVSDNAVRKRVKSFRASGLID